MNRFPSLACAASLLLLSAPAGAALPQAPGLVEALIIEGELSPYTDPLGDAWIYENLSQARPGTDGGWTASVVLKRSVDPGDTTTAIIGQLPGQLGGRIDVYLAADSASGDEFLLPSLVGQELTYILRERDPATGAITDTLIQGDTALVGTGDPVQGAAGWTWTSFSELTVTRSGKIFVVGQALEPTTNSDRFMISEVTGGEVLMNGFDFFPGVPRRISWYRFAASPDGHHWAAAARTRITQEYMLIKDGALVEFAPGFLAYEGEPVPPPISGGGASSTWWTFEAVDLNDRGDLAFHGTWRDGPSTTLERSWVRNGRAIPNVISAVVLDERGGLIQLGGLPAGGQVKIDSKGIMPGQFLWVDTDRDGVANPDVLTSFFRGDPVVTSDPGLLTEAVIRNQSTGQSFEAFLRLRNYRIDDARCEGSPNSSGSGARAYVSGSLVAGTNEARVDLLELPPQSNGYLLFSLGSGPGVIPPGAQGELCLAGSIGRLNTSPFTASAGGTARVGLNLNAIPQPGGSVRVMAGETWYTQGWYRDAVGGVPTSNFTTALAVAFE